VRKNYQRKERKSNHKFEVVRGQELLVQVPLPIAEVWAELQAQVEELTGQAGLQILRAILENEVTRRTSASAESCRRLCALGEASRLRGLRWTENSAGTTTDTHARRPGSGTGELRSVAAKRKNCNARCGNAWWPDGRHGIIGVR
jgi:hypothetical protein